MITTLPAWWEKNDFNLLNELEKFLDTAFTLNHSFQKQLYAALPATIVPGGEYGRSRSFL